MSDLFCPATLLLARHAQAAYVETWFSDEGGWLTPQGRDEARALGQSLQGRRIAQVWSSDVARSAQTAEIAAAAAGGPRVETRRGLREVFVGSLTGQPFDVARLHEVTDQWLAGDLDPRFPGGESGHDVVARYRDVLTEIADAYRGETVLVIGHELAITTAVHALSLGRPLRSATARDDRLPNCGFAELDVDADGWRLRSWAGRTLTP